VALKKILIRLGIIAVILGAAGWGAKAIYDQMPQRQAEVASTKVKQGDVIVKSYARGELRAVRSAQLTAPNLFGTVQVTKLASLGAFAREKDLIVEFDDAEVISRLEEKQLELDQIDEQLRKSQADLAIRNNQDQVELLRSRYAVRRAELEVKRNPLLSTIDQQKNDLTLREATQRLKQLESDIKSRQEQAQAEVAVLRERKNKANLELNRERNRLNQIKVLAPMSGLVAIKQNRGSAMMFGMTLPDIREGDQVQPGTPVAEILDLSELEVVAKVGELDRANLKEDQEVVIRLDAMAEKTFKGKIKSLSSTASANMFSSDPAKKFDVLFSVDMREMLSSLGAKPEQIQKVLATAAANRGKAPTPSFGGFGGGGMMMAMGGGGMPGGMGGMGGGMPGGMGGMGGGMPGGGGPPGGGRAGGGMAGMGAMMQDLTPEQQTKVREVMAKAFGGKNPMEMSAEDRTKAFSKIREEVRKITGRDMPARGAGGGGRGGAGSAPGAGGEGRPQMSLRIGEMPKFDEIAPPPPRRNGPPEVKLAPEIANAKLPPPPEADSGLEVLLRPGLLSDVEIIVEKVPNAINVPNQAVFERNGQMLVYVRMPNGKFEERPIKALKRSESVMIIASGVKAGETVALADPNAKPGEQKKKGSSGAGSGAPAGMPGMGNKGSR
jgi:HlyD family secretion protein